MRQQIALFSFMILTGLFLTGCISAKKQLYYEPGVERETVQFRRVAIVPNRLPLNLNDPEKWRKYNWEVAEEFFRERGLEVVDYATSVEVFQNSGLPVEDTKASRDKYAQLAEQLAADMIVVPYYGTFTTTKNLLIFTSMKWESVTTFQIFLKNQDAFISRMDATGTDNYVSGLWVFPVAALQLLAAGSSSGGGASGVLIGLGSLAGFAIDLSQTVFRSNDSHWRSAFRKSIRDGLTTLLETFPNYATKPRRGKTIDIEQLLETDRTTSLPNFRAAMPSFNAYSDEQVLAAYRQKFPKFKDASDEQLTKLIEAKYNPQK